MIGVGINENVFLEKVALNEKNVIEITFQEAGKVKEKPASMFASVAGDEIQEGQMGMSIRLFPPLPPQKEDMTDEKKRDLIDADINKTKAIIRHLLLGYLTSADLVGMWASSFDGLPIDESNYKEQFLKKEILEGIHRNMGRIFIEKITPFLNDQERKFRLLLVRQSREKHFATFRGRYIEDNPFFESMEIPADHSKVKFTPYELSEGLNSGVPIPKEAADKKDTGSNAPNPPMTVGNVFG
jgi:hypothetical protein